MARIKRNQKQSSTGTKDFLLFLGSVMKRPGMYSIFNVEGFSLIILGYLAGSRNMDCINLISDFKEFVNKECKIDKRRDRDWPRIVRFYTAGDMHSLELSIILFEKFMAQKKIVIPELK